jgi:hypothetical protein
MAVLTTWPLALHPQSLFGATDPSGDPSLNLWTLGWNLQTLTTHPSWLFTNRIFDADIFHPARRTLAYSDHLLLQAIAVSPVYLVTRDLVLCYNLLLLASLIGAAVTMHLFARELTGSERAAYTAGLIFGFAPFHITHLTHLQLQSLYWLPLTFFYLHRLFVRRRATDTIALGTVMGLQVLSSAYYGVIGAIGLGCAAVVTAALSGRLLDWRLARRGLAAIAVAAIVALPWSIPYFQVSREAGAGRTLFETSHASAVLASYVQAPPENALYGRTGWLRPGDGARLPRKDGPEQALFPGFLPMLLAAAGFAIAVAPRRNDQKAHDWQRLAWAYALVTVVGVVLSLGPDGVRPLYATTYNTVFGMQAIRAAARFSVLALFGIAILAAFAVAAFDSRRRTWFPCIIALIGLEYSNGAIAFPPRPALSSDIGRWLGQQPGRGAVVCLPIAFDTASTRCMLQALEHRRPVVNGYSGLRPPFYAALVDTMSRMPAPESLLAAHDIDVEYIVSDRPLPLDPSLGSAIVERVRFDEGVVYQLQWSPAVEAALTASTGPPPPDPGPVGFAVGESARYQVRWTSGPMGVAAGEATVSVAPGPAGEGFRFLVSAKSAPWVSRFLELDASLETTATVRLLPEAHSEHIREGRKIVDRKLEFDFARRQVRMTTGGPAIALPLAAEARDPLTALFYLRTLPLSTGSRFVFPLTDTGRPSTLDVTVGPLETITLGARSWTAWRVEPRIRNRVERRAPLALTAWLSDDARRLPIAVEVAAEFGKARVELVEYRAQ